VDYLIYLGGGIKGLSYDEATKWREIFIDKYKEASTSYTRFIGLSPLRGKEFLSGINKLKDAHGEHILASEKVITERDFNDVKRSDLIIMNFLKATSISRGSLLEIGAAKVLNIPLITVMEEDNIHQHSMVRESSIIVCDDIDDAFDYSLQILGTTK